MDVQVAVHSGEQSQWGMEAKLRADILSGRLEPGSRLPPTREYAARLGVPRKVVVRCYERLKAEGLLTARVGSGTRVALVLPENSRSAERDADQARAAVQPGLAHPDLFPREQWARHVVRAIHRATLPAGPVAPGLEGVTEARLALYLTRTRSISTRSENVFLTRGHRAAVTVFLDAARQRGVDTIAVEDPCPRWQVSLARRAGFDIVDIPVDAHGIDVGRLVVSGADMVCVSPIQHVPTGVALSAERRRLLVAWARDGGRWVVEVDDGSSVPGRFGAASLQGVAPDRIAYVGGVGATLEAGLDIGWLVVPDALRRPVEHEMAEGFHRPGHFDRAALGSFVGSGDLDRHLVAARREYAARRMRLLDALAEVGVHPAPLGGEGALQVWVPLPPGSVDGRVAARARAEGVAVWAFGEVCHTATQRTGLVVGLAVRSATAAETVARILRRVIDEEVVDDPGELRAAVGQGRSA